MFSKVIKYHIMLAYVIKYDDLCKVNERTIFNNVRQTKPLKPLL